MEDAGGDRQTPKSDKIPIASDEVTSSYQISTEAYEGPIDLFYDLVVADRIDPTLLNLSMMVESFISEMSDDPPAELEHLSEFLWVLALLCRLKARRVLGKNRDFLAEEPVENPDRHLWNRLAHLTFQDSVEHLMELLERGAGRHARQAGPDWSKLDTPPRTVVRLDPEELAELVGGVMERVVAVADLDHLALDLPTVEEATARLWKLIEGAGDSSFDAVSQVCADRVEEAAWFMGLMELAHGGRVLVSQEVPEGAILIRGLCPPGALTLRGGRE